MIFLEVAGNEYRGFTEIEVTKSMENFCGSFSFKASSQGRIKVPFPVGSSCRILVDTVPVITGIIDKIDVGYSGSSHSISISGRDKTSDVLDSTIDGEFEINPPESLKGLTERVLSLYNITGITVIDLVGDLSKFSGDEIISADIGDTLYDLIERHCRLRQVFATTNADGNIELIRGATTKSGTSLISDSEHPASNILSASVSYDNSNRFYKYKSWSQSNIGGETDGEETDDLVDQSGQAFDNDIRKSRTNHFVSEKSSSDGDLEKRAIWEANIRRARSFEYTATVQGHSKSGINNPWKFNELVYVRDTFSNIDADLLIKTVKFRLDNDGGSTTELEMVTKDSFTLQAEQNEREARASLEGDDFEEEDL